ncbi:4a-hydroxytetrahydrobiopterin dehydratase [Paenibacillus baekrokdamisoli]|uniref:4a-hydroxytetrahydrobiopterin dehydratase n=2 Tax=Paenibacillus baekrokdamisoli TaxID=1712516 RepID=A0A3G9IWQ6_9BACL|nr:4a-hydroxytetrahydrobiopterin dehydratase [Paenibacillus baekrokdamisoli]BBH23290.1 4a-hydroxytetrahydrobiopterin dehydratase [Paenibacillus baekrokdamisoli]
MSRMEKMSLAAADERIAAIEGWIRDDDKWMQGSYRFAAFTDAIAFVGKVADIAEALNHHPFIGIDFKKVTLRLTTWSAGGLTELDMKSADQYNDVYRSFMGK